MRSRLFSILTVIVLCSCLVLCSFASVSTVYASTTDSRAETFPEGRAIITWKEGVSPENRNRLLNESSFVSEYSDSDFSIGFFPDPESYNTVKHSPCVLSIEEDSAVFPQALTDAKSLLACTGSAEQQKVEISLPLSVLLPSAM